MKRKSEMMDEICQTYVPSFWFKWLLAFHVLVWTLVSALTRPNGPSDTLETILWGRQFEWGYDKHPPLSAWLAGLISSLHPQHDWPLYLLGQMCVVLTFYVVWKLGEKWLTSLHALVGVVLLEGIYYYNIGATQYNPNVLMLPIWALMVFFAYEALKTQNTRAWLWVGFFSALGLLTKYETSLLILTLFMFTLRYPEGRESYRHKGIYLGLFLGIVMLVPHFMWLVDHQFISLHYLSHRLEEHFPNFLPSFLVRFYYPFYFTFEQALTLLPVLLLFYPIYKCSKAETSLESFDKKFVVFMACVPFVLPLLYSFITSTYLYPLWGYPLFSLLGLLLITLWQPKFGYKRIEQFGKWAIIFMGAMLLTRSLYLVVMPSLTQQTNFAHFPGKRMTLAFTHLWHQSFNTPLPYVAGHRTLVQNVVAYSPDRPQGYIFWDKTLSPWIHEEKMQEKGALFLWMGDSTQKSDIDAIQSRFPTMILLPEYIFPMETKADVTPLKIYAAFLPPKPVLEKESRDETESASSETTLDTSSSDTAPPAPKEKTTE